MKVKAVETKNYEIEVDTNDHDTAIELASEAIREGVAPVKTHYIEFINSDPIPSDVAEKTINNIINYIANKHSEETNVEESTIYELLKIGISGEVLIDYFGFNMMSVSEVLDDIEEIRKNKVIDRFTETAQNRDFLMSKEDCEKLIAINEKEGSSLSELEDMPQNDMQIMIDDFMSEYYCL